MTNVLFETLKGKTLVGIFREEDDEIGNEILWFVTSDGGVYYQAHDQSCCEEVRIEDICGDLNVLIGFPLIEAEEVSNENETEWGSETWTFYKLRTEKGAVTIRWYGSSNGYYSEEVSFYRTEATPPRKSGSVAGFENITKK